MIAFMFPGQGSQQRGMGASLLDEFSSLTAEADDVLGYSIKRLCLEDPNGQLDQTQFTQPALYVVNAVSYLKKLLVSGRRPDYLAGHSLGEYNALFAAGVVDFVTGLRLAAKRGELMARARDGSMAAVLGMGVDQIRNVLLESGLDNVDLANLNTPSQVVVSGPREDIERAGPFFKAAGARAYTSLKVSAAFHSRLMADAEREFAEFLRGFDLSPPRIPVISNVTARPYPMDDIAGQLIQQITHSVNWTDTIRYLLAVGVDEIEQVGPGNVLTGLVQAIRREAEPLRLEEPAELAPPRSQPVAGLAKDAVARDAELSTATRARAPMARPFAHCGGTAAWLGSQEFRRDHNLRYAYASGSMYRGIASPELVVRMARAGMLGFIGTGGLRPGEVDAAITYVRSRLDAGETFGVNLLHEPGEPAIEEDNVERYLKLGVPLIEASAFMDVTRALVRYRCTGLHRDAHGRAVARNWVMAKVSRPEVATAFLSPPPSRLVEQLVVAGKLTQEEAALAREIPMADDLTVEADSAGHTDGGITYVLMPAMLRLRDELADQYGYRQRVRIGAAGGIGTPEAAAAAVVLGADYLMTGSVNQCTVEAGTSDPVKDLLQQMGVQDTAYAPAGDMFELGARVQVLKRGVFFPARANRLHSLYQQFSSLEDIDAKTRQQLEERYFQRPFDDVYEIVREHKPLEEIAKAEQNPKYKMLLVFKWYFAYTTQLALEGDPHNRVDYQIHCGPALGAFNAWVKGTPLEEWRNRHADDIGRRLLEETATLLERRLAALDNGQVSTLSTIDPERSPRQPGTTATAPRLASMNGRWS